MEILTIDKIRQPRTPHLIASGQKLGDWHTGQELLGGTTQRQILCPSRDWTPYITETQTQRNANFDSFSCVSFAHDHGVELLAKLKGFPLDESKRWTAIRSGTKPNHGTSMNAVAECIRTKGGVAEADCPTITPTMTQDEYYTSIPASVDAKENLLHYGWKFNYEWIQRDGLFSSSSAPDVIWQNLQYSPIPVCVEGNYTFNAQGEVVYGGSPYAHCVLIVGGVQGQFFTIFDSESPEGLIKFSYAYKFGYSELIYLDKPMNQLIKEDGSAAVYLQVPSGNLYAISDSEEITGGDLLKVFSGSYGNANILHIPSIDKGRIIGEVKALKTI